jgi:FkbM family methyltransferase
LGYQGRIVSFEPVHANAEALKARVSGDPNWMVKEMALGSKSERKQMNVPGDTVLASFLDPTVFALENFPDSEPRRRDEVLVGRVDEILDECTSGIDRPRVYLKMDTQGWDLEVFAGASGRLDQVVALQSELSVIAIGQGMPTYLEALAEYQRNGYQLTGLYPIARDKQARIIEFDAVMVRRDPSQQGQER